MHQIESKQQLKPAGSSEMAISPSKQAGTEEVAAAPALSQAQEDPDSLTREEAVSLARTGEKASVPALSQYQEDADSPPREEADSSAATGEEADFPALSQALEDPAKSLELRMLALRLVNTVRGDIFYFTADNISHKQPLCLAHSPSLVHHTIFLQSIFLRHNIQRRR
jgi:HEAT repeat protein